MREERIRCILLGMAKEIERKYLVISSKLPKLTQGITYVQGYLSLDPLIRFRIIGNKVEITIKKLIDGGVSREEWEFSKEFSARECEELIQLAKKKPIIKVRYTLKFKDLLWEIDEYKGENKGLITADIEIPQKEHEIQFPEWIDFTQEITDDPRYFNKNLGDNPYKSWSNTKEK